MRLGRAVLLQSYKMYGELGLVGDFGRCGKARSAWKISIVLQAQLKEEEARNYRAEAEEIRLLHGGDLTKSECDEDDFNVLLNYMDS